jgi:prepilin-type processing-associated H-X9-DG protein
MGKSLLIFLTFAGLILVVVGYLVLPDAGSGRPARRTVCMHNLRQIGTALEFCEATLGKHLPAVSVTKDHGLRHSWRVRILPFLELDNLYRQYSFDEAWDGPGNSRLHSAAPQVYRCPIDDSGEGLSSYFAITGFASPWTGASPHDLDEPVPIVVEMQPSRTNWMAPEDIDIRELLSIARQSPERLSRHGGTVNVLFSDGMVRYVTASELIDLLSALPAEQ